jgi:hypothetical protein
VWRRKLRRPQDELERICQATVENAVRLSLPLGTCRMRGKQLAEVLAQAPEPDPTTVRLVLRDEASGRAFRVTLPAEWVESRWD